MEYDPGQKEAVESRLRRLRVIAGAGTGKTSTMVARTERLLREGDADPSKTLLLTFTRKAASEMRQRLAGTLGKRVAASIRAATFHSLGLRILRRYWREAGFEDDTFAILSADEAVETMKQAVLESDAWKAFVDPAEVGSGQLEKHPSVQDAMKACVSQIESWKQCGLTRQHIDDPDRAAGSEQTEAIARAYLTYMDELETNNAADFGDLLLKPLVVFRDHPEIAEAEADAVDHILVDEFQDTNPVQWRLLETLAGSAKTVTVLGDPDQAIYSFRNATPEIIDRFEHDGDAVLETNRRCGEPILDAANNLIDHNPGRYNKWLSSGINGPAVKTSGHMSDYQEGAFIAKRIKSLLRDGVEPDQIAVLLRSCSGRYTDPLEGFLVQENIPYTIVGGTQILERTEIKDLFGFLQMAVDPDNAIAFRRIANKPRRGIGPAALNRIEQYASRHEVSFHAACSALSDPEREGGLSKKARSGAAELAELLFVLSDMYDRGSSPADIVDTAMAQSRYRDVIAEQSDKQRLTLDKMIRAVKASDELGYFLQEAALLMDQDERDEDQKRVRISTVHAAKGLEFQHVICPAFEDGIFPHTLALASESVGDLDDPWRGPGEDGLAEERRLAYVAFTRARETLHVSWARRRARSQHGPSQFFQEAGLEPPAAYDPKSGRTASGGTKTKRRSKTKGSSKKPAEVDTAASENQGRAVAVQPSLDIG